MATSTAGLIEGIYTVEFGRKLEHAADPLPAYVASGGGAPAMAVQVARGWPARARVLSVLSGASVRNVLTPMAHGRAATPAGETGYFVVCATPPGPSLLSDLRPWSEPELIEHVIKPVATALAALQAKAVTHRAIRPGNVFQAARGTPVTLGPAWAAPPAAHQPCWVEPPYSAVCQPAGRGDGTIADDVYALGALVLMLALGENPVGGLSDEEVLYRKLDAGSYAALAGSHRLAGSLADLIGGMLADDPEHRPSPTLLATPAAARARRIAARPIRRASRPIKIEGQPASTARTLAHALVREPKAGVALLRDGTLDGWLKRGLGDAVVAGQMEDVVRAREAQTTGGRRADATLVAHAVAVLDPLAPLVWRSAILWPDALGPALDHALHHSPDLAPQLTEIVAGQIGDAWAKRRGKTNDAPARRSEDIIIRSLLAAEDSTDKPAQLSYVLNPLTPCESPLVKRAWVTGLPDLIPALETAMAVRPPAGQPLIDTHIAAFICARRDERLQGDLGRLAATIPPDDTLAQLRLIARLQAKLHIDRLPNLSAWAAEIAQPLIQRYRSRTRRVRLAEEIASLAKAGELAPLAALLDNEEERATDQDRCANASNRLAEVEHRLAALASDGARQTARARRLGQDVAGSLGLLACLAALAFAVFA